MKYKAINGWTKATMKEQFKKMNNGTKCTNVRGACTYRGPNNNACAVGAFIPDEFYSRSLENKTPREPEFILDIGYDNLDFGFFDIKPELSMFVPLEPQGLLEMQMVHDTGENSGVHKRVCEWIDKNVKD